MKDLISTKAEMHLLVIVVAISSTPCCHNKPCQRPPVQTWGRIHPIKITGDHFQVLCFVLTQGYAFKSLIRLEFYSKELLPTQILNIASCFSEEVDVDKLIAVIRSFSLGQGCL